MENQTNPQENTPFITVSIKKPLIEFVSIPEGSFRMGAIETHDDERVVTLSAFKMSKYAITFDQYDMYCEAIGREKPEDEGWGRGKRPVINVSWFDAKAFADFLGYRLPTDAEWEYACRAGTTTKFNTGNQITPLQANFRGGDPYNTEASKDFLAKTMPVGTYPPNAWGLYEMHGNVNEWCMDIYGEFSSEPAINPTGAEAGPHRICRGGNWADLDAFIYSAVRGLSNPKHANFQLGFRLAMPV